MSSRNQRTQARVSKLARSAQFYFAISSLSGGQQRRSGNTEPQMLYLHESDPLSYQTVAQC